MKAAEKNLLLALRTRLQTAIVSGGAGLTTDQANVEPEEMAPATVGDFYVALTPTGSTEGPYHGTSGGIQDLIYGVSAAVIKRIGAIPRDRLRDVFIANVAALNALVDKVVVAIDWKYEVTNAANVLILAETGSAEGFIHPLVLSGPIGKPRWCPAEMFAGKNDETKAGLMRVIPFGGARRITTIS